MYGKIKMNILEKIIVHKKEELAFKADYYICLESAFKKKELRVPESKDFLKSLQEKGEMPKLIAEIKKCSPSKGEIFPQGDILRIAEIYEKSGAAAISVLSDEKFFSGSINDVATVSQKVRIPVLRKDFIMEDSQILEAALYGASAVLLMVSVLKTQKRVRIFREYTEALGLHALVETKSEAEIELAVQAGAKIIGVNSRDFEDLSVDLDRLPSLLSKIPEGIVRVAESGIYTPEDIEKLVPYCDAILVGTSFMKTQDYGEMGKLVKTFRGK